jgi:hypothetical protein
MKTKALPPKGAEPLDQFQLSPEKAASNMDKEQKDLVWYRCLLID